MPDKTPGAKMMRLQFELTPAEQADFEALMLDGARTKKELFMTAMTLLKVAVRQRYKGDRIGSMSATGSFTEVLMPYLESLPIPKQQPPARMPGIL